MPPLPHPFMAFRGDSRFSYMLHSGQCVSFQLKPPMEVTGGFLNYGGGTFL